MPHRPKFDEPWMDELDGENCVSKAVSLGINGALIGKYSTRTVHALVQAVILCMHC